MIIVSWKIAKSKFKQIKKKKKQELKFQNICYSTKYFQSQEIGLKNQEEEESGLQDSDDR